MGWSSPVHTRSSTLALGLYDSNTLIHNKAWFTYTWAELASASYAQVVDVVSDLGLIDYDTTGTATMPNDVVARSEVASYNVHDAAEAMRLVAEELGLLHVGSTDNDMIQFYLTYRALVMSTSNLSDWP